MYRLAMVFKGLLNVNMLSLSQSGTGFWDSTIAIFSPDLSMDYHRKIIIGVSHYLDEHRVHEYKL